MLTANSKTKHKLKTGMLKKSLLFVLLFGITFLIENAKLQNINPDSVYFKFENRILVILFLLILLITIGKKYIYLLNTEPIKKMESYVWIIITLFVIYIMMGFENIEFRLFSLGFSYYVLQLVGVVILVPIQEEFLYRGFLLLVPNQKIKYLMLIISSIIFALLHDNPMQFFWMGLGFGILAIRFNNIWIPIITHAIWNLVASFFDFF